MKICGLQKTTLLDFPGHVAATIFLGGCNFRCPFCHNSELLGRDTEALCSQEEVMTFLANTLRRSGRFYPQDQADGLLNQIGYQRL